MSNEIPLDARGALRAVRRRWRTVVNWLLLGVVAGAGLLLFQSRWPSARALVILPEAGTAANGQSARDMATQIQIATSTNVLARAARSVRPPLAIHVLRDRVDVTAPTEDILAVSVRTSSGRDAVTLANALAKSYVEYSTNATSKRVASLVAGLKTQAARLSQEASDLQTQIGQHAGLVATLPPGSAAASAESATLATLQARYGDIVQQLDSVDTQIGNADLGGSLASTGASVLEEATSATPPSLLSAARPLGVGAFVGLIVGSVVALVRDRQDDRLRRRSEIARALGAPLIGSIHALHARRSRKLVAGLRDYAPRGADVESSRRILEWVRREGDVPTRLSVLVRATDRSALCAAVQLAVFSARSGARTALVVTGTDRTASSVRAGLARAVARGSAPPDLVASESGDSNEVTDDVDLRLSVTADMDALAEPAALLVAVTSGTAAAGDLMMIAGSAAAAGCPVAGVIVVDPDPGDVTGTPALLELHRGPGASPVLGSGAGQS